MLEASLAFAKQLQSVVSNICTPTGANKLFERQAKSQPRWRFATMCHLR